MDSEPRGTKGSDTITLDTQTSEIQESDTQIPDTQASETHSLDKVHFRTGKPEKVVHTTDAVVPVSLGHAASTYGNSAVIEEQILKRVTERLTEENHIRTHYYMKVCISAFLSALLLVIGVPVFIIGRYTGSLSYSALGVVLAAFGLILAIAVVILLFKPPFKSKPLE